MVVGADAAVGVKPAVVDLLGGAGVTLGAAMVAGVAVVDCAGIGEAWAGADTLCVAGVPADGAGALVC